MTALPPRGLSALLVLGSVFAALMPWRESKAQVATATARAIGEPRWRIGAGAGGFSARSALIVGSDGRDTYLQSGPALALDVQLHLGRPVALYTNATVALSHVVRGTVVQPAGDGSTDEALVYTGTGGFVFALPWSAHFQPTIRLGGGLKGLSFDLPGAVTKWRPTGDFGLGFRGVSAGAVDATVEVRYLPGSFDQASLPTRGIVTQMQRQTDLLFTVGFTVRP